MLLVLCYSVTYRSYNNNLRKSQNEHETILANQQSGMNLTSFSSLIFISF